VSKSLSRSTSSLIDSDAMAAIEAIDLYKRFGDLVAVDGVSFKVDSGEVFGFLGPNGAGKTTTLRMLTGILPPDRGRAVVLGLDVWENPIRVRERIGIVPESSNVYIDLTVWQNMMLMAELYGVPRDVRASRARSLLEAMGLLKRKDEKAKRLSKGLRQRLLICMALIHEPELLILDEPTGGLDVQSAREIRDMLRRMNREEGVTIFLTTHNMWEAEELCHRVAVINHGKIAAVSGVEELKNTVSRLHTIEARFEEKVDPSGFSEALGCDVAVLEGGRYRVQVEDVDEAIRRIVDYARERNLRILSLNVVQPSLEDVFLEILKR